MKCSSCNADMSTHDHGKCHVCNKHCGCSFDPTSLNDYCKNHRPKVSKVKNEIIKIMKIGQGIKYKKRKFGIITGFSGDYIEFIWHNGMKPCHDYGCKKDIEEISRDKIEDYIQKSGNTSLWAYLKDENQIEITIDFDKELNEPFSTVESIISEALSKNGFELSKFRTTYVECKKLTAEMPQGLMLALLLTDKGGYSWYLHKLSGKYIFKFS